MAGIALQVGELLESMGTPYDTGHFLHSCYMVRQRFGSYFSLQWRHNEPDCVSNHQAHDCLLNRLFRRRSKKTSKLRVTGLWAESSPGTGEFSAQKASYAENVSIWWRRHVTWFGRDSSYFYFNTLSQSDSTRVSLVGDYRQTSNISRTKSQHLNVSGLLLQLSFPNPLTPGVKSKMEMQSEQRRCSNYIWVINTFIVLLLLLLILEQLILEVWR